MMRKDCSLDCSNCLLEYICFPSRRNNMEEKNIIEKAEADDDVKYPSVKLSQLIREVISVKKIIMYPTYYQDKDELYNSLDYLEHELLSLKNPDVSLIRDW